VDRLIPFLKLGDCCGFFFVPRLLTKGLSVPHLSQGLRREVIFVGNPSFKLSVIQVLHGRTCLRSIARETTVLLSPYMCCHSLPVSSYMFPFVSAESTRVIHFFVLWSFSFPNLWPDGRTRWLVLPTSPPPLRTRLSIVPPFLF